MHELGIFSRYHIADYYNQLSKNAHNELVNVVFIVLVVFSAKSEQGLEGRGVLIPHSRPFFARIPHPSRFFIIFPNPAFLSQKNTFKSNFYKR